MEKETVQGSIFSGCYLFFDLKSNKDTVVKDFENNGGKRILTFANKKITHYCHREGTKKNYEKAIENKLKIVSPEWILQSVEKNEKLKEDDYKENFIEIDTVIDK